MIIMLAPDSKKVAVEISRYMFDISCISCISKLFHQYLIFCFRPDRREPFPKAPLTQLIIDHCKYILSDTQGKVIFSITYRFKRYFLNKGI